MTRRNTWREMNHERIRAFGAAQQSTRTQEGEMSENTGETRRGMDAEQAGYEHTGAIIRALEAGMPLADVEAAVSGQERPRAGRRLLRCQECGQTGYAGEYPFSTLGGGQPCDDCC